MADKHIAPAWQLKAFRCPLCDVHAQQTWKVVYILRDAGWSPFASAIQPPAEGPQAQPIRGCLLAFCAYCKGFSIWLEERLVWPVTSTGPLPNEDLGEDIVALYNEARAVASQSPRSAAALLRLCTEMLVQRLCQESKVPWTNLNDGIGQLVQPSLPQEIQQALDTLRVIGNSAVHPGQVDLADDRETVERLFEILNLIANDRITQPRAIRSLYDKLPAGQRQAVETRDGKTQEA